jgi:hypothetical protein
VSGLAVRIHVDVFYDDERTLEDLPVTDWDFKWDAESATKSIGSLTVQWQGGRGESLSPRQFLDKVAPFGQQVAVLAEIGYGTTYSETVLLGRFRINQAPQAVDDWFGFNGRPYVSGSTVQLTVGDLLSAVGRRGFRWPGVPRFTGSTWDEIQFISGLPIDSDPLPDKPTPADFVYQPTQSGRLDAIQQLMSWLGGVAVTNSFGELTAIPFAPDLTTTLALTMSTRGTVLQVQTGLDATYLSNEVVGTYQDDDGTPIYAWAYVGTGPLAIGGPFGSVTAYDSDQTVTTQDAANARVRRVLQQLLLAQTNRVTVSCLFDPRAEIGDVATLTGPQAVKADGTLSDPLWTIAGRIVSLEWSSSSRGLMTVVLDVTAEQMGATISVGSPSP